MPSSRRTRGRARQRLRADLETRPCQALLPLPDEKSSCPSHAHGQGRYCAAHGREYGQLTRAYKDAFDRVDALEEEIQHIMERVDALDSIAALDTAVASASRFLDALGEEISGRETHHKRFFQTVDKNHEKWLKRRKKQEAAAMRLLERLRKRREDAIATEVAAKADEERRREVESLAQRTAIAKAQLWAVEEAQRRANEDQARWRVVEHERIRSIAEAQPTAAQGRSVLGERTNSTSSNQKDAGPKSEWAPPTGPRSSVAPSPHLLYQAPLPEYPPRAHETYYSTRHVQNTGKSCPPMRSAGTTRTSVSVAPISSWPVDIERQAAPAAHANWQAHPERTTLRYEVSVDCECIRTALFWVATFSVFCYLVVVEGLRRSYRLVLASGIF